MHRALHLTRIVAATSVRRSNIPYIPPTQQTFRHAFRSLSSTPPSDAPPTQESTAGGPKPDEEESEGDSDAKNEEKDVEDASQIPKFTPPSSYDVKQSLLGFVDGVKDTWAELLESSRPKQLDMSKNIALPKSHQAVNDEVSVRARGGKRLMCSADAGPVRNIAANSSARRCRFLVAGEVRGE